MRILVTGASGFVGRHLVPALLGAGHSLRCLSRQPPSDGRLRATVDWISGDLLDLSVGDLREADAVVHLAAAGPGSSPLDLERVNVLGTDHLLRQCIGARVGRFVYASSTAAMEDSGDAYGRSKRAAEALVGAAPLAWTVLRPSEILASDNARWRGFVDRLAQKSWVFVVKGAIVHPVHIDDVVDAFLAVLREKSTVGRTYVLSGPPIALEEYYRLIGLAAPAAFRVVRIPNALYRMACRFRRYLPEPLATKLGYLSAGTQPLDANLGGAADDLGYRPRPAAQTIRDSLKPIAKPSAD